MVPPLVTNLSRQGSLYSRFSGFRLIMIPYIHQFPNLHSRYAVLWSRTGVSHAFCGAAVVALYHFYDSTLGHQGRNITQYPMLENV